jgi:molecular chaperone HscB
MTTPTSGTQGLPDFFTLLGIERRFDLDLDQLGDRFRALIARFHPDRFVGATAAEQRVAAQWAAHTNAAQVTLQDPVKRAGYLLSLRGVVLADAEREPVPGEFLMQQLLLREQAAEAQSDSDARETLTATVDALWQSTLASFREAMERDCLRDASSAWVKMQYVAKLSRELGLPVKG